MLASRRREAHQCVPCGMKFDAIDSLAARIMRSKLRRIAVGGVGERERLSASQRLAPVLELGRRESTFTRNGFLQRDVGQIEIAALVRRRLIGKRRRDQRCDQAGGGRIALFGRNALQISSCVSMYGPPIKSMQ